MFKKKNKNIEAPITEENLVDVTTEEDVTVDADVEEIEVDAPDAEGESEEVTSKKPFILKRLFKKKPTFYKKKLFYIIMVIVLTILLLADLIIGIFAPVGMTNGFSRGDMDTTALEGMTFDADTTDDASSDDASSDDTSTDSFGGRGNMGGGMGGDMSDMQMPDATSDTDSADTDAATSSVTDQSAAPDDLDSEMFVDGDTSSMPSMGDMSEMGDMSDFDSSSIPGMGDGTSDTESTDVIATSTKSSTSFLQWVKSYFILLGIILLVLDIVSIVMLVIISKREKKAAEALLREQMLASGEIHIIRPTKKVKKSSPFTWIIPIVGLFLLVMLVKAMAAETTSSDAASEATVYTEEAGTADIATVLPGAGTLTEDDGETIDINENVEIAKWYVSDGDEVSEGDLIAQVDKVSVMTAIVSVQDLITTLDSELADCEDSEIDDEITAAADARVMVIYVEEDDAIVDVMYDEGCLMLLSIDGYLAVSMETTADISAGDSVLVTTSDDEELTGKVESYINGTAIILVADDEGTLDDTVTVTTEDGDAIGSGTLYIHSELKVTGYTGTVSAVDVEEGDEVDSGDTLIELTDTEYTAEYDSLVATRNELEEELAELFELYTDGYIYASASGVISGLADANETEDADEDDEDSDGDSDDTDTSEDSSTDDTDESASIESDSTTQYASVAKKVTISATSMSTRSTGKASSTSKVTTVASTEVTSEAETIEVTSEEVEATTEVTTKAELASSNTDYSNVIGTITAIADDGTLTLKTLADKVTITDYTDLSTVDMSTENMTEDATATIASNILTMTVKNGSITLGQTEYAVGDILIFAYDSDDVLAFVIKVEEDDTTDTTQQGATDQNADSQMGDSTQTGDTTQTGSDTQMGDTNGTDMSSMTGDTTGNTNGDMSSMTADTTGSDMSSMTGDTSASASTATDLTASVSTDGTAADGASTEVATTSYTVGTQSICTITPQDSMVITITIDELDILSIEVGLDALVTLDAFPGQSFEGVVTAINTDSGTNSGGSSKFTAEVTIAREENMLVGMNAAVVITLETATNVLAIPENALVEQDGATYVYTTYDEKTEELGGLVEVTTGVSDGENVEILSGLSEGDTYVYSILDVINVSTSTYSGSGGTFSIQSIMGGSSGGIGGR